MPWMLRVVIHSCVRCATHSTSARACWTVSTTFALAACEAGLRMAACPVHCASKCPKPREGEVCLGPGVALGVNGEVLSLSRRDGSSLLP